NPTFGFVKNPYDLSRIPGGSSGGTAAALAARIVPIGIGSDTTGSVRMPPPFCGIAGPRPPTPKAHKPYPTARIVPLPLASAAPGPMARSVADVALVHTAVTRGPELTAVDLRGVRIGVPRGYYWDTLDPGVAKVMDETLAKLRDGGAVFVDVDFSDLIKA